MVLVVYRQMPARLVAVSKRKRHHVAGAPVLRWRASSCAACSSTCCNVALPVGACVDELESGVAHAPSAGLAGGDDGFLAPQLGDGAEDGAPVAVEES